MEVPFATRCGPEKKRYEVLQLPFLADHAAVVSCLAMSTFAFACRRLRFALRKSAVTLLGF